MWWRWFRFTAISYILMNAMDNFLPFLFGFHNKALAFVDKISTGDSKSFEIHSQVFFLSFITWREKKLLYEETVSTSALLFNTRNQDYAQIKKSVQTFIFIWIGFALHKLISQFQLCMMCHFLWLNLQKDFISTRCCFLCESKAT